MDTVFLSKMVDPRLNRTTKWNRSDDGRAVLPSSNRYLSLPSVAASVRNMAKNGLSVLSKKVSMWDDPIRN